MKCLTDRQQFQAQVSELDPAGDFRAKGSAASTLHQPDKRMGSAARRALNSVTQALCIYYKGTPDESSPPAPRLAEAVG
jgi:hypothetical protein